MYILQTETKKMVETETESLVDLCLQSIQPPIHPPSTHEIMILIEISLSKLLAQNYYVEYCIVKTVLV